MHIATFGDLFTKMDFELFGEVFAIPFLALVANIGLRNAVKIPMSAAGDLLMFLVVFDGVVLFREESVKKLLSPNLNINFVQAFTFLLVVAFVTWAMTVTQFEPRIEHGYNRELGQYEDGAFPWTPFCCAWGLAFILCVCHLLLFIA